MNRYYCESRLQARILEAVGPSQAAEAFALDFHAGASMVVVRVVEPDGKDQFQFEVEVKRRAVARLVRER